MKGGRPGSGREQLAHLAEEFIGHHLGDPPEHALPDGRDEPADLYVRAVGDTGDAALLRERDERIGLDEAGPPASVGREAVRLRRLLVAEPNLALEGALHPADADLERRLVLVVAERFELLAAGDRLLEDGGVEER